MYDCGKLPNEATPAWMEDTGSDTGPTVGVPDFFKTVDDPDIPGNKLLEINTPVGSSREIYSVSWNAVASTGATAVYRLKPSATLKDVIAGDLSFTANHLLGQVILSNAAFTDDIRIQFGMTNKVFEPVWNRNKVFVPARTISPADTVLSKWHIYRMTIKNGDVAIYFDENPAPACFGTTATASTKSTLGIGDNGNTATVNGLFDWIVWDASGAYAPGQGTLLPKELTGLTAVEEIRSAAPEDFVLHQNYPNPFNPTTTIEFATNRAGMVILSVCDVHGKQIRNLVHQWVGAGMHRVVWDGKDARGDAIPAGIYFGLLETENAKRTMKMCLIR